MSKRHNDGNLTGLKQDKYRNSRFEVETNYDDFSNGRYGRDPRFEGVSSVTPNTINGKWSENRGHRSADDTIHDDMNPFENGHLENWNHRKGWNPHFYEDSRNGGALLAEGHRGKGPKGYKRDDNRIFEDVCETLSLSPNVDASDIVVEVKEGCVFLRGFIDSRNSKKIAELEIESISGVADVQNLLTINRERGSAHV
jgi:hypothetical protein